jgi:hypothetical protein
MGSPHTHTGDSAKRAVPSPNACPCTHEFIPNCPGLHPGQFGTGFDPFTFDFGPTAGRKPARKAEPNENEVVNN